ncbi:MAG: ATP-binding cassette domain-containing protein, partial [Chitinivibrionales bacterium]|nr:ATP-binding cassette domain-containing protein [Chitinivibrionales bacterium]
MNDPAVQAATRGPRRGWLSYLRAGLARPAADDPLSTGSTRRSAWQAFRAVHPFIRHGYRSVAFGTLLVIIGALLALPVPLVMRHLVDKVLPNGTAKALIAVLGLLTGLKAASVVLSRWSSFHFARLEAHMRVSVQSALLRRLLRYPVRFFDRHAGGYLMGRLTGDVSGLGLFFSSALGNVLTGAVTAVGGLAILAHLDWRLTSGVAAGVPLLLLVAHWSLRRMRTLAHARMESSADALSSLHKALRSITLVKSLGAEKHTSRGVTERLNNALQASLEQMAVGGVAEAATGLVPAFAHLAVLAIGGWWVMNDRWTLGSLFAFHSALGLVFGPARQSTSLYMQFQRVVASVQRIAALLDTVPEASGRLRPERLRGVVSFDGVSFGYDDREHVLRDVTFRIGAASHVAVMGPSGIGKTTLLALLLRFHCQTTGEIRYDGHPAEELDLGWLRERIGYVPQVSELPGDTIIEAIRYGAPDMSLEQVRAAARAAGLDGFIRSLPDGYDTRIGDNGLQLSEGQ